MDAALLDQLETEHRQVEELFAKLEKADSESEQRPLVEELATALTRHMKIEETEVYPEVAKVDAEMEQEAETEHQLGRDGIATLQTMVGQPGFGAKFNQGGTRLDSKHQSHYKGGNTHQGK